MKNKLKVFRYPIAKRAIRAVMKTFIFLFCTTVFSFNTSNIFSQETITLDADKELSVDEVFDIISTQTKYRFLYPQALFEETQKVKVKKGIIPLSELLKLSFSTNKYNFRFSEDDTILIEESQKIALSDGPQAKQQLAISGTVYDFDGQPLPGANILEKGTTNGTQTDFDGNFSIEIADENAILVFSYIGFFDKRG